MTDVCSDAVGWGQEGHPACKKLGVGLLVVITDWSFYSSSCRHHLHHP